MFDIKEESDLKSVAECLRLGKLHYDELFKDRQEKIPMNYNWDLIKVYVENGLVHTLTARIDGELIGYFVVLVGADIFSSTFIARELVAFVRDDYRKQGVFEAMLKTAEELLTENGVASLMLTFKEGHNHALPEKFGYSPSERVYEKILGD